MSTTAETVEGHPFMFLSTPQALVQVSSNGMLALYGFNQFRMLIQSPRWIVLSQKATANLQQSALISAISFTTLALALLIVPLRWYSRMRLAPGTWHGEDFLITAALLLSIGMIAVVGVGRLYLSISHQTTITLQLVFVQSLLYQLAINLVKTTFTLQYLRILSYLPYPKCYCYILLLLIFSASLLIMKPLYAKWVLAMVPEQFVSASEDERGLRRLTGLVLLNGGLVNEEKAVEQAQAMRDTAAPGLSRSHGSQGSEVPVMMEIPSSLGSNASTFTSKHQ